MTHRTTYFWRHMDDEASDTDAVERTLRLLRGLAEQGIVPLLVEVGADSVRVQVASLVRGQDGDGQPEAPTGSRSYVGRALAARKVG